MRAGAERVQGFGQGSCLASLATLCRKYILRYFLPRILGWEDRVIVTPGRDQDEEEEE